MRKGKPLRKYGTILFHSVIIVHAKSKVEAARKYMDNGIIVTVPNIFELENEFGIPIRGGRPSLKKDEK